MYISGYPIFVVADLGSLYNKKITKFKIFFIIYNKLNVFDCHYQTLDIYCKQLYYIMNHSNFIFTLYYLIFSLIK